MTSPERATVCAWDEWGRCRGPGRWWPWNINQMWLVRGLVSVTYSLSLLHWLQWFTCVGSAASSQVCVFQWLCVLVT